VPRDLRCVLISGRGARNLTQIHHPDDATHVALPHDDRFRHVSRSESSNHDDYSLNSLVLDDREALELSNTKENRVIR
jgi:hypothetical protein